MKKFWHFLIDCIEALVRDDWAVSKDDKQLKWLRFLGSTKW